MDTHASRKRLAASFLLRDALLGILLCALGLLCLWVLQPFLSPILWAAILAYVTWPLHSRLRTAFRRFTGTAALVTTVLVGVVVVAPVFWLLILLQRELVDAYRELTAFLSRGPHPLPEFIRNLPGLGSWLQDTLDRYASDPAALNRELILWL
jgi:predicted PurR-regulated permease PerM